MGGIVRNALFALIHFKMANMSKNAWKEFSQLIFPVRFQDTDNFSFRETDDPGQQTFTQPVGMPV